MQGWAYLAAGAIILSGCGLAEEGARKAALPAGAGPATARVQVRPPTGWRLQALLTANQVRLHHVNLRLFRRAPDGSWPATPETTRLGLTAAALGQIISLGQLKFGASYRLQLEAYAAGTESLSTLLSDAAGSQVSFTMPTPSLVGGVLRVARETVFQAPLVLLNTLYDGQASYQLTLGNAQVTHVRLDLATPAGVVATRLYSRGSLPSSGSLHNLKLATPYTLQATGLKGGANGESLVTASATLTTPGVSASGTVETGPFGPLTLTLN
ncbi:MAG: hypothetical protein VKP62_13275 [Candidatus Sericytochromatia bacterium]|nr:hypothetical protein [Candidatus Sericytochromatia bacterium]